MANADESAAGWRSEQGLPLLDGALVTGGGLSPVCPRLMLPGPPPLNVLFGRSMLDGSHGCVGSNSAGQLSKRPSSYNCLLDLAMRRGFLAVYVSPGVFEIAKTFVII